MRSGQTRCRRSSTSAPPCVSRACRAAGPARSPANARRAVAGTSRFASSLGSRARSASGELCCCGKSPPSLGYSETLDREAVDSLLRDGLVERSGELVRLPA